MDLRQGIARGASCSLGLRAEVALVAWLRANTRMRHDAARVIVKPEPIQWNFHCLLVTGFESHASYGCCADESLWILAADRGVEEVEIVHRVVTHGGCAIGLAFRLWIGWSHSVCTTNGGLEDTVLIVRKASREVYGVGCF
jgi:hypothetical protein